MSTWPRTRDGLQWGTALAIVFVAVDLLVAIDFEPRRKAAIFVRCQSPGRNADHKPDGVAGDLDGVRRKPLFVRSVCLAIVGLFPIIVETMWDLPSRFRFVQPSEMLAIVAGFTLLLPMPGFVLRLIGFDIVTRGCFKAGRQESDSSPRFVVSLVQVVVWFAAFVSIITTVTSDIWMLWLWTMLLAAIAPGAAWQRFPDAELRFDLRHFFPL